MFRCKCKRVSQYDITVLCWNGRLVCIYSLNVLLVCCTGFLICNTSEAVELNCVLRPLSSYGYIGLPRERGSPLLKFYGALMCPKEKL